MQITFPNDPNLVDVSGEFPLLGDTSTIDIEPQEFNDHLVYNVELGGKKWFLYYKIFGSIHGWILTDSHYQFENRWWPPKGAYVLGEVDDPLDLDGLVWWVRRDDFSPGEPTLIPGGFPGSAYRQAVINLECGMYMHACGVYYVGRRIWVQKFCAIGRRENFGAGKNLAQKLCAQKFNT